MYCGIINDCGGSIVCLIGTPWHPQQTNIMKCYSLNLLIMQLHSREKPLRGFFPRKLTPQNLIKLQVDLLRIIQITLSSDHQEICRVFSSHCGNQPVLPRRPSPSFTGTASDRGWKLHPQDGCRVSSKKRAADISHQQLRHDVRCTTGKTMLVAI